MGGFPAPLSQFNLALEPIRFSSAASYFLDGTGRNEERDSQSFLLIPANIMFALHSCQMGRMDDS